MKFFINDFFSDCAILTDYIEQLEFVHNRRRHKLNSNNKQRNSKTFSMLYGLTPYSRITKDLNRVKDPNSKYYQTMAFTAYPQLMEIFKEFGKLHFNDYDFDTITINKNLQCKEHKDKLNTKESIMLGLGDYRGGLLGIRDEKGKVKFHETQYKLIRFNGSKFSHFTTPFKGTRYTLVFYKLHWSIKKKRINTQ